MIGNYAERPEKYLMCGSCGWGAGPNAPPDGTCPMCGEGEILTYLRADTAERVGELETVIPRTVLAELADYARDDIVMHGVHDDDLQHAVVTAYDALDHEDERL